MFNYNIIDTHQMFSTWMCLVFSSSHAAAAKSLQSCPILCNPIDGSPQGSPVPGILQARTLEWAAISFSNAWKWKVKGKSLSRVRLFPTPWTTAYQAPPSMGFSRQEYWSGVLLPSPKTMLVTDEITELQFLSTSEYMTWQSLYNLLFKQAKITSNYIQT